MSTSITRRSLLKTLAGGSLGLALAPAMSHARLASPLKGTIRHSVCRWTYGMLPLEELCTVVTDLGFSAIDLVGPAEWDVLKRHEIDSSMCNGAEISLEKGWNRPEHHETLIQRYTDHIDLVSKAGYTNLICFSGNRDGMDDETGLENCAVGLQKIMPIAEQKGVVIQMELFNSKVNHPDYMCDSSAWGVALCERIGSPNFKMLYDIYHMQVQEGDIIATIRKHHAWFGHYHTAGVPGRHEIDDSQELNYPAIMREIAATGYKGYVAQEFISNKETTEEKIASLAQAIAICDV